MSVELTSSPAPFTAGSESFPVNVGSGSVALDSSEEESRLYSVNWYKDGKEFFRFMPSMENKVQVFPVDGVNVEVRSQS